MVKRFSWDELSKERMIGYGTEGIVFQLSDYLCLKVYAPEKKNISVHEYKIMKKMAAAGIQVPSAEEVVVVSVPKHKRVELPRNDEIFGRGLYSYEGPLELFALMREFIHGKVYGKFFPSVGEIRSFLRYLDVCSQKGFDFRQDIHMNNFVLSQRGVYAIDVSHVSPVEKDLLSLVKGCFREEMLSSANVFTRPLLSAEWDIAEYLLLRE